MTFKDASLPGAEAASPDASAAPDATPLAHQWDAAASNAGRLLTATQVAAILAVSTQRVYELVRSGRLPAVHLGRQVRFDEHALRLWIESGGTGPSDAGSERDGSATP